MSKLPFLFLVLFSCMTEASVTRDWPFIMRDGVTLRGDIYGLPEGQGDKRPVLLYRTPYGKHQQFEDNRSIITEALRRGYVVVVQDVRGRYGSEGVFFPYHHETADGVDTIESIAQQWWSNGRVGMFGLSYPGAAQWLAALGHPEALKAIAPAMTFSSLRNGIYFGGTFDLGWFYWSWFEIVPEALRRLGKPVPSYEDQEKRWNSLGRDYGVTTRYPLGDNPLFTTTAPFIQEWLSHPPESPYWDFAEVRDHFSEIKIPVLNLSGWHDEAYGPLGATEAYARLMKSRESAEDPATALIMGPWTHGEHGSAWAGKRTFKENAVIDYDDLVLDWMDRYVKRDTRVVTGSGKARYYVMGKNQWAESMSWPPKSCRMVPYYLVPGSSRRSGELGANAGPKSLSVSFLSDPSKPVRDVEGANDGAYDFRSLSKRPDVLTFETGLLPRDLNVSGNIEGTLYVSLDAPDTDLFLTILDVHPDGTAYNLMSPGLAVERLSYQDFQLNGFTGGRRKYASKGEVIPVRFKRLLTSNEFKKGHRIRVVISTTWFPLHSRNTHSRFPETEGASYKKAMITLNQGPRARSEVRFPVCP